MKAFINDIEKQRIKKEYPIVEYLEKKGYEPVKMKNGEWLYRSPGSNESTPSFWVNIKKNVYMDYSGNNSNTGEKGDIIRLVMCLENISNFVDACNLIVNSDFKAVTNFGYDTTANIDEKKGIEILNVRSICRWAMVNYIESRRIKFSLANRFLKEIDYKVNDTRYFSIGFQNDKGGFALRSALFKGQTMPQYFTTLKGVESDTINIFEGFFSMLSCLQDFGFDCYKNTTYVLNSIHNLNKLIPLIPDNVKYINAFMDNDEAGKKALAKLSGYDWQVFDKSDLYKGYNDYNEFLMNK